MSPRQTPQPPSSEPDPHDPSHTVSYATHREHDSFTVDSLDAYQDLCVYAHLSQTPVVIVDRQGHPWTLRTDVHGDLYGSRMAACISGMDEIAITADRMLDHLSPARAIII